MRCMGARKLTHVPQDGLYGADLHAWACRQAQALREGRLPRVEEAIAQAYEDARDEASAETNMPLKTFPELCRYSQSDIFDREFTI